MEKKPSLLVPGGHPAAMNRLIKRIGESLIGMIFRGRFRGFDNADVALRYLPIAEEILRGGMPSPSILEVGSGVTGITPFLPYPITGADVSFAGEVSDRLRPVPLSGPDLPFGDETFDYVISVDMLEHAKPADRPRFVSEMIRVARREVILAVPCGRLSEAQDRELDEYFFRKRGERYGFLAEHVENGLPTEEEILSWMAAAPGARDPKRDVAVRWNVNLKVRNLYMKVWIIPGMYPFFLLLSLVLCMLGRRLDRGECYRRIFFLLVRKADA
ncbi:MAG: class I SAM-dependent methyltransferase [bacterium]|jgi:hypothetical protein